MANGASGGMRRFDPNAEDIYSLMPADLQRDGFHRTENCTTCDDGLVDDITDEMPTAATMFGSAARAAIKFARRGFTLADEAIQMERLEQCVNCDRLQKSRCIDCGCFVALKVKLLDEKCPLDKWP